VGRDIQILGASDEQLRLIREALASQPGTVVQVDAAPLTDRVRLVADLNVPLLDGPMVVGYRHKVTVFCYRDGTGDRLAGKPGKEVWDTPDPETPDSLLTSMRNRALELIDEARGQ
jgi:hypothetical protein